MYFVPYLVPISDRFLHPPGRTPVAHRNRHAQPPTSRAPPAPLVEKRLRPATERVRRSKNLDEFSKTTKHFGSPHRGFIVLFFSNILFVLLLCSLLFFLWSPKQPKPFRVIQCDSWSFKFSH